MISAEKCWKLLVTVNQTVNRDYFYVTDKEQYGVDELWVPIDQTGKGDCEDYALMKRKILMAELPADALRIAMCWTEDGQYHAVLVVVTDTGDYVLDNRYDFIVPWSLLPYRWHKMQDRDGTWRKMVA